jgi:16S rRNA G966 N2-methylase RsmD
VLRANIERLDYNRKSTVHRQDARRRMAAGIASGERYELILLDPPYRMLPALQAPFSLHLPLLLVPDGLAVVESPATAPPLELPLELETTRARGASRLTVYRNA